MAPLTTSPEDAMGTSHQSSLETLRKDGIENVQISAWEVGLDEERASTPARMVTAVHVERLVKLDNCSTESCFTRTGDVISGEVKCTMKDLVATERATLIKEFLEEVLGSPLPNSQSGIRSISHNVFEHMMLDLLCNDVLEDTLDAHTAKFSDIDAATDRVSRRSLMSTTFMAPITKFVRRKTDTTKEEKYSNALDTKSLMDSVEAVHKVGDSPPGH